MKIIHHIKKIRQQPEHIRRHILHVVIVFCGIILVLLWIYSLGTTLTNSDNQAKMSQDLKPFTVLKDNMVGGYQNITN
jgi:hypothetical protein